MVGACGVRDHAAVLPRLRERADRGGGTTLPPLRLQHVPLCAQHHPQGGTRRPALGRGRLSQAFPFLRLRRHRRQPRRLPLSTLSRAPFRSAADLWALSVRSTTLRKPQRFPPPWVPAPTLAPSSAFTAAATVIPLKLRHIGPCCAQKPSAVAQLMQTKSRSSPRAYHVLTLTPSPTCFSDFKSYCPLPHQHQAASWTISRRAHGARRAFALTVAKFALPLDSHLTHWSCLYRILNCSPSVQCIVLPFVIVSIGLVTFEYIT